MVAVTESITLADSVNGNESDAKLLRLTESSGDGSVDDKDTLVAELLEESLVVHELDAVACE